MSPSRGCVSLHRAIFTFLLIDVTWTASAATAAQGTPGIASVIDGPMPGTGVAVSNSAPARQAKASDDEFVGSGLFLAVVIGGGVVLLCCVCLPLVSYCGKHRHEAAKARESEDHDTGRFSHNSSKKIVEAKADPGSAEADMADPEKNSTQQDKEPKDANGDDRKADAEIVKQAAVDSADLESGTANGGDPKAQDQAPASDVGSTDGGKLQPMFPQELEGAGIADAPAGPVVAGAPPAPQIEGCAQSACQGCFPAKEPEVTASATPLSAA